MSGIWNLTTLCRCCHADGLFKSLNSPHKVDDNVEIYVEMLKNTLGLYLQSPGFEVSYTICDTCIKKLMEACKFKKQVLQCEKKFQEYCNNELLQQVEIKIEKAEDKEVVVKPEIVKNEDNNSIDVYDNDNIEQEPETLEISFELEEKNENTIIEKEKPRLSNKSNPKKKPSLKSNLKWCNRIKTDNGFKYSCKKCSANFDLYKYLFRHIYRKHKKEFNCKICFETFDEHKKYINHYKKHKEKKLHKCEYCDKTYNNLPSLYYHTNTHIQKKQFICDICSKVFLHKISLKKHILWHMGISKKIMCDVCGHPFNDITNMNKHKSAVHDKIRPFKCNLCPKTFASSKNLLYHIRRHTDDRPFKCDLCQKAFITITILNKHKKTHDPKEQIGDPKSYKCKICSISFDHKGVYLTHVKNHDFIKPFICDTCGKGFCTQYTLNRHIDSHNGIKRFLCKLCNMSLSTKTLLNRHLEKIHDPNRPVKKKITCEICKMVVTDIEKHRKSHMNKRFQCSFCSRSYSERNTLHRHIKHNHTGITYACNLCEKFYVQKGSLKNHMKRAHAVKMKEE